MTQAITLHAGLTNMPPGIARLRELFKLQLRARLQQRQTRIWLKLLNSHPVFGDLLQAYPRLVHKVYRHYLSKSLSCQQRVSMLVDHYHFILQQGWGKLMVQAAHQPVMLATVPGKSGSLYHLRLSSLFRMDREGEMVLQLIHDDDVLYTVVFTFFGCRTRAPSDTGVGIGCIQGPQGAEGLRRVREATRDLHGMRPKFLMIRLVRQLAYEHGCRTMLLVGNANRAGHHSAKKNGRLLADYNALWQELGATARSDGDFELPCETLPALVLEEIASKKRSEARKRHELTLNMIDSLRNGLASHRSHVHVAVPGIAMAANDTQHPAEFDDEHFSAAT
ncbi:VirK/YbjX family protein [Janthinobacterium sp. SUN137]|uniref:VirK/YbjX family protein n=1 Tax=Janthinobacterium sp. SUN137 TaxID=3014789 RepID=UPI002712FD8C|nr:VirK/YbjX family protein [Janthinobacterium sp. SUN137]MDO8038348.1 VirK/YbjX family protein [Janthinobacterium sp. SUN137]